VKQGAWHCQDLVVFISTAKRVSFFGWVECSAQSPILQYSSGKMEAWIKPWLYAFGVLGDGFGAGDVGLLLSMPAAVASLVANFGFAGTLGRTLLFYLIY
jgi:hypothetical protein